MQNKSLFVGIIGLVFINCLQAYFTPITEDEAYYWLWSQNLDWGYFDHPPMIAWWNAVGYNILPNELGLRLITVLLNACSFLFLWKLLNPKTQNQIRLFWTSTLSVLVIQAFGFLATPDAPLLFFSLFYLLALRKFISNQNISTTLLLGLTMAGLVYSKYHGILVIVFTLVPLVKEFYKNQKLFYAIAFGIVLYIPHIIWLFIHEFSPIRYHFFERSSDEHFEWRKLFNYLGMYIFGAAPVLSYFIWNSIFKFKSKDLFQKSIWCLAIFPGIFFFFSIFKDNVQPQWLLISFISMIILMYWNYAEKEKLKWIWISGISGIVLVIILRILVMIPSISPFTKNKIFAENAGSFNPVNPVFEKYQEASVYNFYHPLQRVFVHRTIGNRKSQFDIWNWEESLNGQTITYISPWIQSDKRFKGYKNRDYFLKEIEDYQTYQLIKIKTLSHLLTKPGEQINLGLKIINKHDREISIGGNSNLQFSVNYYQEIQYNIKHREIAKISQIVLSPGEELDIQISFTNLEQAGNYKVCIGIDNKQVGTTYLSNVIDLRVN